MDSKIKYPIAKKAYEIDLERLDEGYLSDNKICYADNRNEAKRLLLDEIKYDDWKLKYNDDYLNYLNIPVIRRKSSDKILFEGEELPKHRVVFVIEERERILKLDNILNDPKITHCYISKRGYYYKANSSGYTSLVSEAGVYSKEDAVSTAKHCSDIRLFIIDIEEHNKLIKEKIKELESKII